MNLFPDTTAFQATASEDFELLIEMTGAELDHHLRLMAALKMFELGQISSGKAAELAGMSRVDFFQTCGRYQVSSFNYPPDEAETELRREVEAFSHIATA
ncbi:MAG: UPF0175 family protein [Verrucomicrobiaceae bacterium]|nr:MAG: UPF0175 family protein [Verrucomicrobiaceae bacterium]